jgi:hypothetical protein
MKNKFLIQNSLLILMFLFSVQIANACGCVSLPRKPNAEEQRKIFTNVLNNSVAVFTGEVISNDMYSAAFKVDKVWKGDVDDEFTMSTGVIKINDKTSRGSSCIRSFQKDRSYLIFANNIDLEYSNGQQLLVAYSCGKSRYLEQASEFIKILDGLVTPEIRNKPVKQ